MKTTHPAGLGDSMLYMTVFARPSSFVGSQSLLSDVAPKSPLAHARALAGIEGVPT